MADLSINPVDVRNTGGRVIRKKAGENLSAGDQVYNFNTTHVKKGSSANETLAGLAGVTINSAYTNQDVDLIADGTLTISAGNVTVGQIYCVSNTSGKFKPYGNMTTNETLSIFGVGATSATVAISINRTGLTMP